MPHESKDIRTQGKEKSAGDSVIQNGQSSEFKSNHFFETIIGENDSKKGGFQTEQELDVASKYRFSGGTKDEEGDGKRSFCTKMTKDKEYRRKYLLTLNLIASIFVLGWSVGQGGPSLLDLGYITNVSLEKASYYFTIGAIGYMLGALITGYVFDKIRNRSIISFISLMLLCVTTALVPWMEWFGWMMVVQFVKGLVGGGIDTTGNALLLATWGSNVEMFMQSLHFGFAIGGTLSPLAIAPFLIPDEDEDSGQNTSQLTTIPSTTLDRTTSNITIDVVNSTTMLQETKESILYIGFSISAGLFLIVAIWMLISFFQEASAKLKENPTHSQEDTITDKKSLKRPQNLTRKMKVLLVIVVLLSFLGYCAVEGAFMSYLSTFCVRELKWSKVKAAVINSAFWGAFAAGRLAGIGLVVIFTPVTLLFLNSTLVLLNLAAILISVKYNFLTGMWVFSSLLGFSMSVIFPSIMTWTEQSFFHVTGRISSLFIIGAASIGSINPLILGKLMDNYTNMWFIYLLLGEAVLYYIIIIFAYFLSRIVRSPDNSFLDVKIDVEPKKIKDKK